MEKQFCSQFPEFLTKIILKMKTGWSFRKSFEYSCKEAPEIYKERLNGIFENVVFSQQFLDKKMTLKPSFLVEVVHIFKKVDQSSHQSIEKLENLRSRLIIIKNFRRKSGVIRGQIQMQCYLLIFIYISCFAGLKKMIQIFKSHYRIINPAKSFGIKCLCNSIQIGFGINL